MAESDMQKACQANLTQATIKASGAGKAYQSVAQSMAIAIQDATDYLRHISSFGLTATGLAMAKFAETEEPHWLKVMEQAQKMMVNAETDFKTIGSAASTVLQGFPAG